MVASSANATTLEWVKHRISYSSYLFGYQMMGYEVESNA
jgi:hypothetical protein